jgi:hypothetical protein
MPQGVLPYKYEEEKTQSGMTALAGLPIYLDLASVLGLGEHIRQHMHIKNRGWTDEQTILSLILLNLAGGDSVDDLEVLEKEGADGKSDGGFGCPQLLVMRLKKSLLYG